MSDIRYADPDEALALMEQGALVVDVREAMEWDQGHIPGSVHLPLSELAARWQELPEAEMTVFVCRSGARSEQAATAFARAGRPNCVNLDGGAQGWAMAGKPFEGSVA
jgi:rhodanese-related sulfurtransferase